MNIISISDETKKTNQPPRSWPNLVGKTGDEAVKTIKKDTGFKNVQTVSQNSPVTMDYQTDRVRVFVNQQGKVTTAPTVG